MQNMSSDGGLCWEYSSYEVRDFWPKLISFNLAVDLRELVVSDFNIRWKFIQIRVKEKHIQHMSAGGDLG